MIALDYLIEEGGYIGPNQTYDIRLRTDWTLLVHSRGIIDCINMAAMKNRMFGAAVAPSSKRKKCLSCRSYAYVKTKLREALSQRYIGYSFFCPL